MTFSNQTLWEKIREKIVFSIREPKVIAYQAILTVISKEKF